MPNRSASLALCPSHPRRRCSGAAARQGSYVAAPRLQRPGAGIATTLVAAQLASATKNESYQRKTKRLTWAKPCQGDATRKQHVPRVAERGFQALFYALVERRAADSRRSCSSSSMDGSLSFMSTGRWAAAGPPEEIEGDRLDRSPRPPVSWNERIA